MSDGTMDSWEDIHTKATVFDIHAHPSLKKTIFNRSLTSVTKAARYFNPFSVRTDFEKLKNGGVNILSSAIYVPEKQLLDDCVPLRLAKVIFPFAAKAFSNPPFEVTLLMLKEIEKAVEASIDEDTGRSYARMACCLEELDKILERKDGQIAFVHSVEGAHSLGSDGKEIENLERLFCCGVASLTLAHFYDNGFAPPVFPFPEYIQKLGCFQGRRDLTKGLSSKGKKVVEKMVELGMIVDITHCTPQARKDVYEIVGTDVPIVASHIGAYEINPSPYNLQDWELEQIAKTGGVAGVIFMNYWLTPYERARGLDFVSQTITHFVKFAGEEHTAIGSDFDGLTDPPDDLKDAEDLPYLTQRLVADGFSRAQIDKILGDNSLRVLRDGWGKKVHASHQECC